MKKIKDRLKKSGGFTLIEMLIVVAIIAILVAISIPMVSSSLDKAKEATDTANERSAKAAAMIEYMTNGKDGTFNYDAIAGKLVKDTTPTGYGQCKKHKDSYIQVTITDGEVTALKWKDGTGTDGTAHGNGGTK